MLSYHFCRLPPVPHCHFDKVFPTQICAFQGLISCVLLRPWMQLNKVQAAGLCRCCAAFIHGAYVHISLPSA